MSLHSNLLFDLAARPFARTRGIGQDRGSFGDMVAWQDLSCRVSKDQFASHLLSRCGRGFHCLVMTA